MVFNLSTPRTQEASYIAAIDLGSNSFHLIIARRDHGHLTLLDRLREPVRLGFGLQDDGSLSQDARDRALACLERFSECLRAYPSRVVRAVGTKTLRSLNNAEQFIADAQTALGHPIEIISGDEEARLIYLGVAQSIAPTKGKRIVIDIGGGSTEIILGEGTKPLMKESLNMGCVAITKRFFSDNKVNDKQVRKAIIACMQELAPVSDAFVEQGWTQVLGASGTIKAVAKVCDAHGWTQGTVNEGKITAKSIDTIIGMYLLQGKTDITMPGLSEDRQAVFLGGVIVLAALFDALKLEKMEAADWALREGLLHDQKGRLENQDIRQDSVNALALRFHVNMEKAKEVEKTAQHLLKQIASEWNLNSVDASQLLTWAAQLYQVGLDISHNDYHKHSAYIVQNVDLAGCSRAEQAQLAALVLAHRRRFPVKAFPNENTALIRLAILLRLATIFHRGRTKNNLPRLELQVSNKKLILNLPEKWLDSHPLTLADLETEQKHLQDIDYQLELIKGR
jgi:exopolyphosphatase / guanosine-5'-triphosphate,3'-diphosphate pyrophosphatase